MIWKGRGSVQGTIVHRGDNSHIGDKGPEETTVQKGRWSVEEMTVRRVNKGLLKGQRSRRDDCPEETRVQRVQQSRGDEGPWRG